MKHYDWSKNKVEEAVKNNKCYSDVLRYLGIPLQGNNIFTLKKKIKDYNLSISHFDFTSNSKSVKMSKDIQEYLTKGSNIKTYKLKEKLFSAGLKENKCEICGCNSWIGKPIACQLHHIDGDNTNNELSNLQILCPNCHSQTDNYCGNSNSRKIKHFCIDCGRPLKTNNSIYCPSCSGKHKRVVDWDSEKDNLEKLVKTKTNLEIGSIYGVSEATIRKYRKKYQI